MLACALFCPLIFTQATKRIAGHRQEIKLPLVVYIRRWVTLAVIIIYAYAEKTSAFLCLQSQRFPAQLLVSCCTQPLLEGLEEAHEATDGGVLRSLAHLLAL